MKKLFFILSFSFMFFFLPNLNVSASVPSVPKVPSSPLSSQFSKYFVWYCGSTCTSDYKDKFALVYYDSYSLDSPYNKNYRFDSAEIYYYDNSSKQWVFMKKGYSLSFSFQKPETGSFVAVKTNDDNFRNSLGSNFFLKIPDNLVSAVQGLPMKKIMEVVVELLPIVVSLIVSCLALKKAFHWLLLQLKGC